MEFFWDQNTDELWIIEINPRISQSHSYQFERVDGMSNHEVAIHVALGDEPGFVHGGGPFSNASKFLLRHYGGDGVVRRCPSQENLKTLRARQPDTRVEIVVKQGQRLSELLDQDAYSFLLAEVFVAGKSQGDMLKKYQEAVSMLDFDIEPVETAVEA